MTKRGKEFWNEFEYYLSDLSVGLVLDVLLVGLMATPAVISKHHSAHNATGASFEGRTKQTDPPILMFPQTLVPCSFVRIIVCFSVSSRTECPCMKFQMSWLTVGRLQK